MQSKVDQMKRFWSQRAKEFGHDLRANTDDVHLREIELSLLRDALAQALVEKGRDRLSIMDFGCANGYSTARLAECLPACRFLGVDINSDMIAVAQAAAADAGLTNLSFLCTDVVQAPPAVDIDLVYGVRVLQNLPDAAAQRRYFDAIRNLLPAGGRFVSIESYQEGHERLNNERRALGLVPLPDHAHLTRLTSEFDAYATSRMQLELSSNPFSTYYLVTRLAYSAMAKMTGEPIDYDHALHRIAARLPAYGDCGPMRLNIYRKL